MMARVCTRSLIAAPRGEHRPQAVRARCSGPLSLQGPRVGRGRPVRDRPCRVRARAPENARLPLRGMISTPGSRLRKRAVDDDQKLPLRDADEFGGVRLKRPLVHGSPLLEQGVTTAHARSGCSFPSPRIVASGSSQRHNPGSAVRTSAAALASFGQASEGDAEAKAGATDVEAALGEDPVVAILKIDNQALPRRPGSRRRQASASAWSLFQTDRYRASRIGKWRSWHPCRPAET